MKPLIPLKEAIGDVTDVVNVMVIRLHCSWHVVLFIYFVLVVWFCSCLLGGLQKQSASCYHAKSRDAGEAMTKKTLR